MEALIGGGLFELEAFSAFSDYALLAALGARTRIAEISSLAGRIYPGYSARAVKGRAMLYVRAFRHRRHLDAFEQRLLLTKSWRRASLTPEVFGLVQWPYLHKEWEVSRRLEAVASHYEALDSVRAHALALDDDDWLGLADLDRIAPGLRLVIDRAPWFKREGQLVLNLFDGDLRIVSVAFSFAIDPSGARSILIGAVQGIHRGVPSEESLAVYRRLTKTLCGLRPKVFAIEVLRMMAALLAIDRMLGVTDANRLHRHPYFGCRGRETFASNYDELWLERGGRLEPSSGFFDIPISGGRKDLAEIPSRKRALYRRRYEMLDEVRAVIGRALAG